MKAFEKIIGYEAIKKELARISDVLNEVLTASDIQRIRSNCQCVSVSI